MGSAVMNGHGSSSTMNTPLAAPSQPHLKPAYRLETVKHPDDDNYGPDTHPPNYPRPGQGLMSTLPPESEDLHYLVEDEDKHNVFTHIYKNDVATATSQNSGPGIGSS